MNQPTHFLLRGRIPAGEEVYAADCALTQISAPPGTEVTDTTEVTEKSDWLIVVVKEPV